MSFNWRMDKQIVYSYSGIQYRNKNKQSTDTCNKMDTCKIGYDR